jgi:GxxExxY protein
MAHTKAQRHEGTSEKDIGKIVFDCAVKLHMELGPGLLESVYEVILTQQLRQRGLNVDRHSVDA